MFETDSNFEDSLNLPDLSSQKRSLDLNSSCNQLKRRKKEEITHSVQKSIRKTPVRRKFPGPAGLSICDSSLHETTNNPGENEIPFSQATFSLFESEPWTSISKQYENLLHKYNISWIKQKANFNELPKQKAPFLAALITKFDHFETCANGILSLKDETGDIKASILFSLVEKYSDDLKQDSVIILKQCSVLTIGLHHHLIITPNNLVAIYVKNGEEFKKIQVQNDISEDISDDLTPKLSKTEEHTPSSAPSTSQNEQEQNIWDNALDGVDFDSLFDGF